MVRTLFSFFTILFRHEVSKHGIGNEDGLDNNSGDDAESSVSEHEKIPTDPIYHYHSARLQCGLIVHNMFDAIQEGDGDRLVRCYKMMLLFNYKFHHTKYAYVLLLFFAKIYALLSEKEVYLLIHNRLLIRRVRKVVTLHWIFI